jgi:hypothetical protein
VQKEGDMKNTRVRIWTVGLLLLLVNLLILACGLGSASAGTTPTRSAGGETPSSSRSVKPTASPQTENSTGLPAPSQTATSTDLSQSNLPAGFPIYPGGHDFTWVPGLMLKYTVDADVRTASNFYATQMGAGGYSDLAGGGGLTGECGGDCGSAPTYTPGPTPTSTPEGWMGSTEQGWVKGSAQIVIDYLANPDGTTDISIVFAGK